MIPRILLFSVILLFVLSLTSSATCAQESYSNLSTEVTIFPDGLADVKQVINVNETVTSISLPLLSTSAENVLVLDEENIPLSYEIKPPNIDIDTLGASKVMLEYIIPDLAKNDGNVWTLKVNTPYNTTITLPDQSQIIYLNDLPSSITSSTKTVLTVPPGSWEISYILQLTVTSTSTSTSAITPTLTPTSTPPVIPPPAPTFPWEIIIAVVAVVIVIAALAGIMLSKRKKPTKL